MQCPTCGVSVLADSGNCRSCGWTLSRPQKAGNGNGRELRARPAALPADPQSENRSHPRFDNSQDKSLHRTSTDKPGQATPKNVGGQASFWGSLRSYRPRRRGRGSRGYPISADALAELGQGAYFAERPRAIECIEMPLVQTTLDFNPADGEEEIPVAHRVAPLAPRFRAGLCDAALILGAAAVFFALFAALGGPEASGALARRDLLIYGIATFALTCLYLGLFTYFGGSTPGMRRYGLIPVRFDGQPLTPADARLRAFGYVVSTGSLLLGFFWAVADEDHLTWHDRISRTLLTQATPPA